MKKKRQLIHESSENNNHMSLSKKQCTENNHSTTFTTESTNALSPDFKLSFVSAKSLAAGPPEERVIKKYHINQKSDIDDLENMLSTELPFKYDRKNNRHITTVNLYVAPVALLGGFGVFAGEDIKANSKIPIGKYAGQRVQTEEEDENSLYIFQLTDKNGEIIEIIDAAHKGDWTREINSSQTGNICAESEEIDGYQKNIFFFVSKNIKQHQQLLFDYGIHYGFKNAKPLYLHPNDNFHTSFEVYWANRKYYSQGKYSFDAKTMADLHLTSEYWILPVVFQYICANDAVSLEQLLANNYPPDLFAYACDEQGLLEKEHQQHLTGFLLSCYLGYSKCIEVFIKYGADINRCMLNAGFNGLILLLMGHGKPEVIDYLGKKLLTEMDFPFVTDSNGLGLLHYLIIKNKANLASLTIDTANKLKDNLLAPMYLQKKDFPIHVDFAYCVQQSYFEILQIFLTKILAKGSVVKKIFLENINGIFKKEFLGKTSLENLLMLQDLISLEDFSSIRKTNFLNVLQECIQSQLSALNQDSNLDQEEKMRIMSLVKRKEFNLHFERLLPEELGHDHLFYKSINYKVGINIQYAATPLKFALLFSFKDVENILNRMESVLKEVSKILAFEMVKELDGYECILIALQMQNEDLYKRILAFYHFADIDKQCILKLLIDAINAFSGAHHEGNVLERLFKDCGSQQFNFSNVQKEQLFIQAVNKFRDLHQKSCYINESVVVAFKFLFQVLVKNFSLIDAKCNTPLIAAIENKLPIELLRLLVNLGNTDGANCKGIAPLLAAIRNGRIDQVKFLLLNVVEPEPTLKVNDAEIARAPSQFSAVVDTLSPTEKRILQSAVSEVIPKKVSVAKRKLSFTSNMNKTSFQVESNDQGHDVICIL